MTKQRAEAIKKWLRGLIHKPEPRNVSKLSMSIRVDVDSDEAERKLDALLAKSDRLRDAMNRYGIGEAEMRADVRKNARQKKAMSRRCLVAICDNRSTIFAETAQSLMELGWGSRVQDAKEAHGFAAVDFAWSRSFPRVDSLRDHIVTKALLSPAGYTHILFLDADMVWPSDVLMRMLRHHDQGIVCGLYHLKGNNYAPVAMRDGQVQESGLTVYAHDLDYRLTGPELREQEVVGMGCTLVPLDVFKAIGPRPWFAYEMDDQGWPAVSEDVPFCRKARAAGFKVLLDPTVKCGHVTTNTVTEQWHLSATEGTITALMEAAAR
jgi:hypothetical protein